MLAGEHRLDRRAVRRRQAHQHPPHARAAECGAEREARRRCAFRKDPVFGFEVPLDVRGGAGRHPRAGAAPGRAAQEYDAKYDALAARFVENFKLFAEGCPAEVIAAGPTRVSRALA